MSLYDAAKDAFKLAQKSNDAELIQKIIEVQKDALDMQDKQQRMQTKIGELEAEVKSLHEAAEFKGKISFDSNCGVYRIEGDVRAFCPKCYDDKGKLSTLHWNEITRYTPTPYYDCAVCGNTTYKGGYSN